MLYVAACFAQRVTRNIHGLKIVVLQSGQLGRFDLQTLLVQLTTSLALLAVSTTVVDLMMTRYVVFLASGADPLLIVIVQSFASS